MTTFVIAAIVVLVLVMAIDPSSRAWLVGSGYVGPIVLALGLGIAVGIVGTYLWVTDSYHARILREIEERNTYDLIERIRRHATRDLD